jgi:chaperonin cofactor prefoldin
MEQTKIYFIGLIILIAVVSTLVLFTNSISNTSLEFAKLEITNLKNNYTALQNQYQALQSQYNMLESNYENLQTNYTDLQNMYQTLQSQYNSLQDNYNSLKDMYSILQSNYTTLQNMYQTLQSQYNTLESNYENLQTNYTNLQNMYQTLQTQYNSLQNQYNNLNNTYWNILTFLGQGNGSVMLQPYQFTYKEIAVPPEFSGIIYITVSASGPVNVFVFDLNDLIQAIKGNPYGYYLYSQGSYINENVSVGPGFYIVFIYNPNNNTVISLSYDITTTYTTEPQLFLNT